VLESWMSLFWSNKTIILFRSIETTACFDRSKQYYCFVSIDRNNSFDFFRRSKQQFRLFWSIKTLFLWWFRSWNQWKIWLIVNKMWWHFSNIYWVSKCALDEHTKTINQKNINDERYCNRSTSTIKMPNNFFFLDEQKTSKKITTNIRKCTK
jgi:hypothetical protein